MMLPAQIKSGLAPTGLLRRSWPGDTGPARYPECKEQRVFALRRCNLAARLL